MYHSLGSAMVFDTETTGVSRSDVVIQFGFVFGHVTHHGPGNKVAFVIEEVHESLWKPLSGTRTAHRIDKKGRACMNEMVQVNPHAETVHGISGELAFNKGEHPENAIRTLIARLSELGKSGGTLVAHNLNFDRRMLLRTAGRHGLADRLRRAMDTIQSQVCTLQSLRKRVTKRSKTSGKISLKLESVYAAALLAGSDSIFIPAGCAHTAAVDAAMAACVYAQISAGPTWTPPARFASKAKRNNAHRRQRVEKKQPVGPAREFNKKYKQQQISHTEHHQCKNINRGTNNNMHTGSTLQVPCVPQRLHLPASAP